MEKKEWNGIEQNEMNTQFYEMSIGKYEYKVDVDIIKSDDKTN